MSDSESIQIVPNHEDARRDRLRAETLGVVVPEEKAAEPDPVQAEEPKAEEEPKPKAEAKSEPKAKTGPVPVQEPAAPTK